MPARVPVKWAPKIHENIKREIISDGKGTSLRKNLSNAIITLFPNKYGIIRNDGKARKHAKASTELEGMR